MEVPEDLKSAFKMVSGSTSAGGFEEAPVLARRGSLSFFTEGVSLNRLWGTAQDIFSLMAGSRLNKHSEFILYSVHSIRYLVPLRTLA